jgi:hypothetical protein
VLPVVGSEPQGSGYFKHPVGNVYCNGEADCKKEAPIGLAGVCQAGWTWRYLRRHNPSWIGHATMVVLRRVMTRLAEIYRPARQSSTRAARPARLPNPWRAGAMAADASTYDFGQFRPRGPPISGPAPLERRPDSH